MFKQNRPINNLPNIKPLEEDSDEVWDRHQSGFKEAVKPTVEFSRHKKLEKYRMKLLKEECAFDDPFHMMFGEE